jgi:hypothetical protein
MAADAEIKILRRAPLLFRARLVRVGFVPGTYGFRKSGAKDVDLADHVRDDAFLGVLAPP